jgi:hypothetical protein
MHARPGARQKEGGRALSLDILGAQPAIEFATVFFFWLNLVSGILVR